MKTTEVTNIIKLLLGSTSILTALVRALCYIIQIASHHFDTLLALLKHLLESENSPQYMDMLHGSFSHRHDTATLKLHKVKI